MPEYKEVIAACGGVFQGIQRGPAQSLVLFADPQSGTTLAVAEADFSPEAILAKLSNSRDGR